MELEDKFYPERRFGGYSDSDCTMRFYLRIDTLLKPDWVLLDVGCGRAAFLDTDDPYKCRLRSFKGRVAKVIGIDVDSNASENPTLDEFRQMDSDTWPVESGTIDAIVSDYVMEHVPDPEVYFSEAQRVLKPGGLIFIRTCNRWHYNYLASSMIPNNLHKKVLRRIQPGRKQEDVFPTLYRCNSRRAAKNMLKRHGLEGVAVLHEPEPGYLSFSAFTLAIGKFIGQHLPESLRAVLYIYARKT